MIVINLVEWAGPDFYCGSGQQIDLPDNIAKGRLAAGLAALPAKPGKGPLIPRLLADRNPDDEP